LVSKACVVIGDRPRRIDAAVDFGHRLPVRILVSRLAKLGLDALGDLAPIGAHVLVPEPRHRVADVGRRVRGKRQDTQLLDLVGQAVVVSVKLA
jgi:hypothetical protein